MEIIDCHAHYDPRLMSAEQMIENMDQIGISKTVLIPYLTDPPEEEKPYSLMAIQRFMFNSNFLRPLAIAITKSTYSEGGVWKMWFLPGKQINYIILNDPDNNTTLNTIKKYPERFLGWIFINPKVNNAMETFEKFSLEKGMIGLKLLPYWHKYDIYEAEPLLAKAESLSLPVSIHLGFGQKGDYLWVLEKFPKLKIILSHLGAPYYKKTWHLVRKNHNLFFDISSTYHVDNSLIRKAINIIGSERCLFGTDTPYGYFDSPKKIKQWVSALPLSDKEKENIFYNNFLNLINN